MDTGVPFGRCGDPAQDTQVAWVRQTDCRLLEVTHIRSAPCRLNLDQAAARGIRDAAEAPFRAGRSEYHLSFVPEGQSADALGAALGNGTIAHVLSPAAAWNGADKITATATRGTPGRLGRTLGLSTAAMEGLTGPVAGERASQLTSVQPTPLGDAAAAVSTQDHGGGCIRIDGDGGDPVAQTIY